MVKHSSEGHKFIYMFLALSPCVLIQKYLHVAGLDLDLGVLASFNVIARWHIISTLYEKLKHASAIVFWEHVVNPWNSLSE